MNLKRLTAVVIAAVAMDAAPVHAAPPPAALPVTIAIKAARVALAACVSEGLTITVTVTDREGVPRVILMSDGTGALSVITSRRKAYTAAALGITTAQLAKNAAAMNFVPESIDPEPVALQGGVPILRHGVVVGGLGVGGADRGDADEVCAIAGLESIKGDLN